MALAALSSVILTAELIRYPAEKDRALTGSVLLFVLIYGFPARLEDCQRPAEPERG